MRTTCANAPHFSSAVLLLTGVDHALCAEFPGAEDAQNVTAQPDAAMVRQKRAIGVAICRDDRVDAALGGPTARKLDVLGTQRLRVDGNEFIRAREPQGLCAERFENARQQIAADRRMLIDANRQARKGARAEEIEIAVEIVVLGIADFSQRSGIDQASLRGEAGRIEG